MTPAGPTLIGLDWGSTRLRAYLFDENAAVVEERTRPWGILAERGAFASVYGELVADWRAAHPSLPAVAAGMIGSSEGWVRAPYCACPAGAGELAAALVDVDTAGHGRLAIVPGIEQRGAAPDVMRGEETQIVGALTLLPPGVTDATLVLPGTHAKWVTVRAGRIERFATYLTGELFAVLTDHSILGRPARAAAALATPVDTAGAGLAFDRGVDIARRGPPRGIAPLLFLTRALVLNESLRPEHSLEFLSGLLIGDEIRAALDPAAAPCALIGEPALTGRYARALAAFGIAAPQLPAAAPAGLWQIAARAGLVAAAAARIVR